jgi:hypothetical protein
VCELLLLTPDQVDRWEEACHEVGVDDTYYQREYLAMVSANGDGEPRLAWLRNELGSVIYPFLERPVLISGADTGLRDITSPYGYGGPCVMSEAEEGRHLLAQEFCRTFHFYCVERRIVSEFIRFHPLLNNAQCLRGVLPTTAIRETVAVDLEAPLEQIWEKRSRKGGCGHLTCWSHAPFQIMAAILTDAWRDCEGVDGQALSCFECKSINPPSGSGSSLRRLAT